MKNCTSFIAALTVFAFIFSAAARADLYWDVNSTNAGSSDDGVPNGTWDAATTTNWTTDGTNGTAATQLWDGTGAIFSAAGEPVGSNYAVHIANAVSASGITFNDVLVTVDSTGGTLTLTDTTPTISIPAATNAATISAPIAGGNVGGNGLTYTGANAATILTLSGANTYSGTTAVTTGTLQLGASGAIPDTSAVILANSAASIFKLNGFNETVKSIGGGGSGSQIDVGGNTLTIDDDGETRVFNGIFVSNGSGKILKVGDGSLTVGGSTGGFSTTFTNGVFQIDDGTVVITNNNAFGSTNQNSKLIINGGTLRRDSITVNLGVQNIEISNSFIYDNNGTADTQLIGNAGSTVTTLKTNPTITVNGGTSAGGVLIFAGNIVDEGGANPARGFTKAGPGTLLLGSPGNAYRGETTIAEGFLRVRKQTMANANGAARIGDGDGRVNLSGGTLEYNGSILATGDPRSFTVTNPVRVTANSGIRYFSTTADVGMAGNLGIDFVFTSNDISGTGGTLTFSHSGTANNNPYRPTFSGSGFDFGQPVVISNHATNATNPTILTSTNGSGTQTWSGAISGTGSYRRTGAGATVFNGANTFSGGTTVDGGTLTASGAAATLGGGNVTVTGGSIEIAAGVADAIANTATLSLLGGGTAGVADVAFANLAAGINDTIAGLILAGNTLGAGTYGSTSSLAANPGLAGLGLDPNDFFAGTGIVTVALPGVPGDFNNDNKVDAADYVTWRLNDVANATLPNDNNLGNQAARYTLWRTSFGNPGAGGGAGLSAGAVPEPASIALLLFGCAALLGRRRWR